MSEQSEPYQTGNEITQRDLIYAFTGKPGDQSRTPDIPMLLERLAIGLKSLEEGPATRRERNAANVLRGVAIRLSQYIGDPAVAALVDELVVRTSQITGL